MADETKNQTDNVSSDSELPFLSHLIELRDRLLRIVIVVSLIFLVLFYFANDLYSIIAHPLLKYLPSGKMLAIDVITPIFTPMKLALVASFFISIPYILHQLWAFIAPGLYQHEKRLALPLLVSSVLLYYAGMAFAYFVVFPMMFNFLSHYVPSGVEMATDISHYLDFVLKMFFAFGVAFEVPVATILLIAAGITTPKKLAKMRPYIIVIAFTLGMLLTPPDVISQVMLAIPMWMLFESGLFFARILLKKRIEELERAEAGVTEDEDSDVDPDEELDKAVKEESDLNKQDPV
ncbi:MAG: twin-arginine translocase subunit TatC [Gammaproteobacteria bacterium]|nr:twin-arginine translocase subunit TatC [Gammaproteobacteria bacterium]